jgi:hypothetical protein
MTQKDQVFIVNVVVIDQTWETMVSIIINQLAGVVTKLRIVAKICKYRGFHQRHHFISMAMEVQVRTSMWYWSFQQGVCPSFSTIDN